MFNLTSSVPKSWQTVSRQADRATADRTTERTVNETAPVNGPVSNTVQPQMRHSQSRDLARDLGSVLRERREAMGASLAEVETATRIRQKYLAALEAEEWHLLPGEVVGRGFLRNYATYLGLDPTEVVERRRAVADPQLAAALYGTSAGSALPPERDVDYRPKDVSLKDEPEGIQQRELRVGPYLTVLGLVVALLMIWWLASNFGREISAGASSMLAAAQTRGAEMRSNEVATPNPTLSVDNPNVVVPVAGENNTNTPQGSDNPAVNSGSNSNTQPLPANPVGQSTPTQAALPATPRALILIPTDTPSAAPVAEVASLPVITETVVVTPTTAPEVLPSPTDTPLPTPTETPLPLPTDTPTAVPTDTPPPVVAAFCADARMAFFTPSVGQILSGAVAITGRAADPNIDYYKLEYAVGANAEGGYVYFDGNKGQVDGGILGTFNTGALPNGDYTIQLTVVDLTGNYPAPCRVSVVIQN